MVRPYKDLVVAKKCSQCKLKESDKCEGQMARSYMELYRCPSFTDTRANKIVQDDVYIPYPVKKKRSNK